MYPELATDLSLPPAECGAAATPFEFDDLCDSNAAPMYGAVDFGASLGSDQSLSCGLQDLLGDRHLNPQVSQPQMLSLVSLLDSIARPPHPSKQPDAGPAPSRPRLTKSRGGSSSSSTQQQPQQHQQQQAVEAKGSQRPHYAVEKRYRSTLNEKYAVLARTLSSEAVQRICRTESRDWAAQVDDASASRDEHGNATRQRKTATLSMTIDTINMLSTCCRREVKDLEQLRTSVHETRKRVRQMLEANPPPPPPGHEQHGGQEEL